MLTTLLIAAATAGSLVASAGSPPVTPSFDQAQRQLARAMREAGPVAGFVPFLAPDAAYLHPGAEIVTGRDAVRALLEAAYAHRRFPSTTLHPWASGASADGRAAYSFGWLEETAVLDDGATGTTFGRFVAAWRRDEGGWRLHAFLRGDGSGPPADPPTDARILDGAPGLPLPSVPAASATEIAIADSRFADLSIAVGYSAAFPAYAADAAVLVQSGESLWNREGIAAGLGGWDPSQRLSWYPLRSEAAASGDLGWSIGHGTFTIDVGGGTVLRFYSKYLTIWIRTADGWRWLLDVGNPRPTP